MHRVTIRPIKCVAATHGGTSHGILQGVLIRLVVALGCIAPLSLTAQPVGAMELSRAVVQLYNDVSAYPPKPGAMTVCYGFVCRRRMEYVFTAGDRAAIGAILSSGRASAAAERAAIQKAVIWFDRRVGPLIGTDKRVARADFRAGADKSNFDCWDTTRNTTGLLLIMQDWKLLHHHTVGDPQYRGNILLGQTPHNTAVLIDRKTRTEWVVDMWTRSYAQPPEVMPVEQWVKLN